MNYLPVPHIQISQVEGARVSHLVAVTEIFGGL